MNLKADNNLPDKFKDTNSNLPWIKLIKDMHGSVETSSLQMVAAINKTGMYKISNWSGSSSNCLKLTLNQVSEENKQYERKMTETNVNDLRSKLMLISRTEDKKEGVEYFLKIFNLAEQIKVIGINLYRSGCIIFKDMYINIFCDQEKKVKLEFCFGGNTGMLTSNKSLITDLKQLVEFLNQCDREWNEHLTDLRSTFPSLNFFRTDQLMDLSSGIAKALKEKTMSPNLLMKLGLISKSISIEQVFSVFEHLQVKEIPQEPISKPDLPPSEEDLIDALVSDFDIEKPTAMASIIANAEDLSIDTLFQWCLDNQAETNKIETLCSNIMTVIWMKKCQKMSLNK